MNICPLLKVMGTSTCCIPGRTAFTLAGQRLEIFSAPVTRKCIEYVQKNFYKYIDGFETQLRLS